MKLLIFFYISILFVGCASVEKRVTNRGSKRFEGQEIPTGEEMKGRLESLRTLETVPRESVYRISPGDKLSIFIYNESDLVRNSYGILHTEGTVVKPDGTVSVKLVGEVRVAGKTIPEATRDIETLFRAYLKSPRVSLLPHEVKKQMFTIIGMVTHPGSFEVTPGMRILDAIAAAGGFPRGKVNEDTVELADLEHAYISREGKILPVNFPDLIQNGVMVNNIPVAEGDYIHIPSNLNREVYIVGEVLSPGAYGYRRDLSLMQLIAKASGMQDRATAQIILVRGSLRDPKVFSFDTDLILKGEMLDVRLQPEDIIFVPKSYLGTWNMILNLLLPSMQTVQSGIILQKLMDD